MGLSDRHSAQAAQTLADSPRHVPMLADLITAEGFDQSGSAADQPEFRDCVDSGVYAKGIGRGVFYRVSFRNAVQVRRLAGFVQRNSGGHVDFIITPTDYGDPSACTILPLYHGAFGNVHDVLFDPGDPTTVDLAVQQLCDVDGDITVVYAARARDLSRFIVEIDKRHRSGVCKPRSITVVEGSDGSRIRASEPDKQLNEIRKASLTSESLQRGYIRLVCTPLANPDTLSKQKSADFTAFKDRFTATGFDASDLDDGWAINAHDALTTVVAAINLIPLLSDGSTRQVTPNQVNIEIGTFSRADRAVPGAAQGPLFFDNDGNRIGDGPKVVQLCPPHDEHLRTYTVEVYPGQDTCPPA
jgi:hypothetical protein